MNIKSLEVSQWITSFGELFLFAVFALVCHPLAVRVEAEAYKSPSAFGDS